MFGSLMSSPLEKTTEKMSSSERAEVKFPRNSASSAETNDTDKFRLPKERDFQRQFYHVYASRLGQMRDRVMEACSEDEKAKVTPLADLDKADKNENIVIIGTLFKNQKLKPNILQELGKKFYISLNIAKMGIGSIKVGSIDI